MTRSCSRGWRRGADTGKAWPSIRRGLQEILASAAQPVVELAALEELLALQGRGAPPRECSQPRPKVHEDQALPVPRAVPAKRSRHSRGMEVASTSLFYQVTASTCTLHPGRRP
jgi:hypothetical protein